MTVQLCSTDAEHGGTDLGREVLRWYRCRVLRQSMAVQMFVKAMTAELHQRNPENKQVLPTCPRPASSSSARAAAGRQG
eukprot:1989003-Rhodomonas_salina.4